MNNNIVTLRLKNIVPRFEHLRFRTPIQWEILPGQSWAVIGSNGAGKSLLIDILTQKYALHHSCKIECIDKNGDCYAIRKVVKSVAFKDIYSIVDKSNSYYQQRWNKGLEHNETTVRELLTDEENLQLDTLSEYFDINHLLDKEVSVLSSGELRKFLIIRSILSNPQILILDNPYIGLDTESRTILDALFVKLTAKGIRLILLVVDPTEIPACITHVLTIKNKEIISQYTYREFVADSSIIPNLFKAYSSQFSELNTGSDTILQSYEKAAVLKHITIKYGEHTILNNLNWEINRGDKWALLGKNGSGKSTLLSLLCGDNPQAYANDITLFDKKRGTGESIWDIKKQIGYVSPEMHLYYLKNVSCLDVVGSGLFDTIGLYRKCSLEQLEEALKWMRLFDIEHLASSSFLTISTGEQRLVLLARVFVKNPDLIILDEPMHGLDIERKKQIKHLIEQYCDATKTLIFVTHYPEEVPDIVDRKMELVKRC